MSTKLFYLFVLCAAFLIFVVVALIRNRKLTEEYALIWIMISTAIIILSFSMHSILKMYAIFKGYAGAGPEILLFFSVVFIMLFLVFISTKLSEYNKAITALSQSVALLSLALETQKNHEKEHEKS